MESNKVFKKTALSLLISGAIFSAHAEVFEFNVLEGNSESHHFNTLKYDQHHKRGKGELMRSAQGINLAQLYVHEGRAVLHQQKDEKGQKQAYSQVFVYNKATLRLGDDEQMEYSEIYMDPGSVLDLYGNVIRLKENGEKTGLLSDTIHANIISNNEEKGGKLVYELNGNRTIEGKIGDKDSSGNISLIYQPTKHGILDLKKDTYLEELIVGTADNDALLRLGKNTNHVAKRVTVNGSSSLYLADNTKMQLERAYLDQRDSLIQADVQDSKATSTLAVNNVTGQGHLVKYGKGTLILVGSFAQQNGTYVQEGNLQLKHANLLSGKFTLHTGARLTGEGTVLAPSIWRVGSNIAPGFNELKDNFSSKTLTFDKVKNEGAYLTLQIDRVGNDITKWNTHRVSIGTLDTNNQTPIPINLILIGSGNVTSSDKNNNGKYDPNEGLSLIQVKELTQGKFDVFRLGNVIDLLNDSRVHPFQLVSFNKGLSLKDYYDYQLHTKLVNVDGTPVDPKIEHITKSGDPLEHDLPEYKPNENKPKEDKPQGDQPKPNAPETDKPKAENPGTDKPKAEKPDAGKPKAENPGTDKPKTERPKTEQPRTSPNTRQAVNSRIPSYLLANLAVYNQAKTVSNLFRNNLWEKDKRNFYVVQTYSKGDYTSDLSYLNYGYNYDSKQHTTLLGGYVPLSNYTDLHAAAAYSVQKVTPDAKADGYSSARYKTASLLAAIQNHWEHIILNTELGAHWHRGKVSTSSHVKAAKVDGYQLQAGMELGYKIQLGNFSVTPVAGLNYHYLDLDVTDKVAKDWNVKTKPYAVFTQHAGSYFGWDNDVVGLKVGAFYEHNDEKRDQLKIRTGANDVVYFGTGHLGNAVLFKANVDIHVSPQFTVGLQAEHRHAVSDAKLKQTNVGAKFEYSF